MYEAAPTAADLNSHLSAGGRVQVTTYGRSTVYDRRHAGMFLQAASGNLYVRRGRVSKDCLTMNAGSVAIVSIRKID